MSYNDESMDVRELIIDLRESIARSFLELETRLEERFVRIDEKFSQVDARFDKIDQRLDYHETWLKGIDKKLDTKADKQDFLYLIKTLEKKEIISVPEAHHIRYSPHSV